MTHDCVGVSAEDTQYRGGDDVPRAPVSPDPVRPSIFRPRRPGRVSVSGQPADVQHLQTRYPKISY